MHPDAALIQQRTMNWVRDFVVAYQICPFAAHVLEQGTLTLNVLTQNDASSALKAVEDALHQMDNQPDIETMLLVIPEFLSDFLDYVDFSWQAEERMHALGYEGIYQLATFHPHYCFAGESADDVTNYTNRSPYPMLHILREASLDKAIDYYGDTQDIPEQNMATLRKLGLDKMKALLRSIE